MLARLTTTEQALLAKRDELTRAEDAVKEAELLLFEKQSAIVALREQIQSAEAQAAAVSGVRTLVEFSNSTGTTRTPIVIDVSAGGFEFLPNAIRVTMADMEKFPVRDNPLLSAILAIHQHRSGRSLTAEPYVLLLVRPGGSLPFYGAQRILTEAKIHYGYELLTAERKVVVDGADLLEPPAVQLGAAGGLPPSRSTLRPTVRYHTGRAVPTRAGRRTTARLRTARRTSTLSQT